MGFKGKKLLLLTCAFFASASVFARSLAFQIVQHNDSMASVCNSAYVIEDELLNYFFENGYIVSNSQASISSCSDDDKKLWCDGYYEASDGSFDDFVQIHLYFGQNPNINETKVSLGMIDSVSWTITSIKTGKCLETNTKSVTKPMGSDTEENVRNFASDFAAHIKKVITNRV